MSAVPTGTPFSEGADRLRAFTAPGSGLLIGAGLLSVAALLFVALPQSVHQDTWLALVDGRQVALHGIPRHDTLTTLALGRSWVDQQWLAQLTMYLVYRAGGLALVGIVDILLVVAALAGATLAARKLGARTLSIGWLLPLVVCTLGTSFEARTEEYAYPLFVALMFILARDVRRRSTEVWLCVPLLVLWANLHGSATLGAGLVSLRGLTYVWERRALLLRELRAWARPIALVMAGPLCLLATPYGTGVVSYYRVTLLNSTLRHLTSEWQPVTSDPTAAILFFVLVAAMLWALARRRFRVPPWEVCALLALAAGGITAVRNVPWFAFASLMLVPPALDRVPWPSFRVGGRWAGPLKLSVALVTLIACLDAVAATAARSDASLSPDYPAPAVAVVGAQLRAHPGWVVWADDDLSDWLLWERSWLAGRVSTDVRFELLRPAELRTEVRLGLRKGADWKRAAQGCRLLLLSKKGSPAAVAGFEHEPGARLLLDRDGIVVILRSAAAARLT